MKIEYYKIRRNYRNDDRTMHWDYYKRIDNNLYYLGNDKLWWDCASQGTYNDKVMSVDPKNIIHISEGEIMLELL